MGLSNCQNAADESCEGGVAAISAFARHRTIHNTTNTEEPYFVWQLSDKQSQFVQVHPLGWAGNRLVLKDYYGWNVFSSVPSLLLQDKDDYEVSQKDLDDLQSMDWKILLTNADVPPSN